MIQPQDKVSPYSLGAIEGSARPQKGVKDTVGTPGLLLDDTQKAYFLSMCSLGRCPSGCHCCGDIHLCIPLALLKGVSFVAVVTGQANDVSAQTPKLWG